MLRGCSTAPFWETLLNISSGKTRLQSVEGVLMNGSGVGIQQLATLTGLTRLGARAYGREDWPMGTRELSRLSALQELDLPGSPLPSNELQVQLRPMTQLLRLRVFQLEGDVVDWSSLLASLPAVTALDIESCPNPVQNPAGFNHNTCANLRSLCAAFGTSVPKTFCGCAQL